MNPQDCNPRFLSPFGSLPLSQPWFHVIALYQNVLRPNPHSFILNVGDIFQYSLPGTPQPYLVSCISSSCLPLVPPLPGCGFSCFVFVDSSLFQRQHSPSEVSSTPRAPVLCIHMPLTSEYLIVVCIDTYLLWPLRYSQPFLLGQVLL